MPPTGPNRRTVLATIAAMVPVLTGCLAGDDPGRESRGTDAPSHRLRIENRSDRRQAVEVTLAVIAEEGRPNGDPDTESYSLEPGERLSLDDRVEPSTDYEVTASVEGGTTERWTLHDYAGLTVVIESADQLDSVLAEA